MIPTKQSIQQAHKRIKPFIHRTPLLSSSIITDKAQCKTLFLKCQNFQKIGAFKPRGAANKLLKLDPKIKTVCCHSSGNHAQAVAYISSKLGLKAYIVMPQNSPAVKKQATIGYGATVVDSGNTIKQREQKCQELMEKYNAQLIHAYDDYDTVEGQATSAKQAFQDYSQQFDYLVFPIGGGGLASGSLLSTKYFGKGCKPVGVQPYLARDAYLSVQKGEKQPQFPPISIADGLRTSLGDKTFGIIKQHLTTDEIILVSQEEIINATQLVLERMKIVIEPSSASVVAAVLKDSRFRNKKVCCIISGGNMDMSSYFSFLKTKAKL